MKFSNNRKFFLNIFTAALAVYGVTALPSFVVAAYFGEGVQAAALGAVAILCCAIGFGLRKMLDLKSTKVRMRMNYMTTIMTWLILIGITTVVFFFGRAEFTWIDSFFEATASLTTTGMGNLDVNIFPYSFQLWRSTLNWLGGVGIILISVSCLSEWEFSGHSLVSVEIPGPEFLKSSVTFKDTYRKIISVYVILTVVHFLLLVTCGMDIFPSVLTALSNISTAGMQHINNGVITHLSIPLKVVITLFAFLGSVNVSVFLLPRFRKFRLLGRRTEVSFYISRLLITAFVIGLAISITTGENLMNAVGKALMQTVAFFSTSGYIVTDCHAWPLICQVIILLQMFIGSCAVSTGGGLKMARADIAVRTVAFGLFRHIHPHAVKPVRFNHEPLKQDQLVKANLFIALFMSIYVIGALFLSLDNKSESIYDALNYSQAMLTNTGTSIAELSAPGLAGQFSPLSKIVMSIEMLAGRLEIYPVIMLLSPAFWKADQS